MIDEPFKTILKAMISGLTLLFIIVCVIIVLSLTFTDISSRQTTFMQKIVQFPLTWSSWIADYLSPSFYEKIRPNGYLIVYGFVTNFILYSVIGHFLLKIISKIRNQNFLSSANPPQPPRFN